MGAVMERGNRGYMDFSKLWDNIPTEKDLEEARLYWNLRAGTFNEQDRDNCRDIQQILKRKGYDPTGKSLLDIGCGPGKCSVELAKGFEFVVGLDLSDQMILHARENARQGGRNNTAFYSMAWEKTDLVKEGWQDRFHVVLASMTPAISNAATLEKMCQAGKELCILSSFVHRRDLKVELEEYLGLRSPTDPLGNKVYLAFNLLWMWGYHPEVSYTRVKIHRETTLEESQDLYRLQLSFNGEQEKKARSFLENKACDGLIVQEYETTIGWLTWNPNIKP